ncbi:MAG: sigma-54-dependent Fis family transcriptional regulator [Acidobacteria bacterium]|nr:sigma-54-dependent Fis family transcriptional regulator [Acidobacteriota bacterium]
MRSNGQVQLIGASRAITDLRAEIEQVARSDAKVLITGESGTGKEVVARTIHAISSRSNNSFVPVNCAGIPETLLESELFGHVRGSFTGAYRDKPGKLEMADHGTILLDEVGEMTQRMQGLLLRFLETGEIQKVGAETAAKVTDVRVMTATSRNIEDLIAAGQFREDLFYRINVIHIVVPPLRQRRDDIPLLIDYFLKGFSNRRLSAAPSISNGSRHQVVHAISPEAMTALMDYHWPGNVRQVENVVERLIVTCRNEVAQIDDLPMEIRAPGRPRGAQAAEVKAQTVADELYRKLLSERESFWNVVYPLYMNREITRNNVRELVHKGLEEARGNYKIVLRLFNMAPTDYKRFLGFLRKHDCHLPFKEYRSFKETERSMPL